MRKHNALITPNRLSRAAKLALVAGLALNGCSSYAKSATTAPTVEVTVPLSPILPDLTPRTTDTPFVTIPEVKRNLLNETVEQQVNGFAGRINKLFLNSGLNGSVSESANGDTSNDVVKFIPNSDGTFTRYYIEVEYASTGSEIDAETAKASGIFLAKDQTATDTERGVFGQDTAVHMFQMPDGNWRVISRTYGAQDATFAFTEPIPEALADQIYPLDITWLEARSADVEAILSAME